MRTVSPACGTRPGLQLFASLQTPLLASHVTEPPAGAAAVPRTTAWSNTPSHLARTVVVPTVTPSTAPSWLTVAIDAFPVVHVTDRPVSTFPFASNSCSVYVRV